MSRYNHCRLKVRSFTLFITLLYNKMVGIRPRYDVILEISNSENSGPNNSEIAILDGTTPQYITDLSGAIHTRILKVV
jgi:hypothetical protein